MTLEMAARVDCVAGYVQCTCEAMLAHSFVYIHHFLVIKINSKPNLLPQLIYAKVAQSQTFIKVSWSNGDLTQTLVQAIPTLISKYVLYVNIISSCFLNAFFSLSTMLLHDLSINFPFFSKALYLSETCLDYLLCFHTPASNCCADIMQKQGRTDAFVSSTKQKATSIRGIPWLW